MRHLTAAAPAAIAGTVALMLSATPAHAVEPPHATSRMPQQPVFTGAAAALNVRLAANTPPETYVVRKGDSVWAVSTRYGLRTADVLALNGLSSSSIIRPGQVLRLTGAIAPAAPAPAPAPAVPAGAYTVVRGDTLSGIAQRHGVTLAAVFAANGLGWSSIIYPGQRIAIPGASSPAPAAPAAPPAQAPAPLSPAPSAPTAGTVYEIKKGDTIFAIAKQNGLSTQAVLSANGLVASSIIYPGQKITIPGTSAPAAATPSPAPAAPAPIVQQSATLDAEQIANVRLIVRVGRELGVPERGIAIAIGAAMQESSLRNLNHGDRDSLGLFQQRPSTGWGTVEEVSNPERSARAFFGGPSDPNGSRTRGLLDIPGWESLSFTQAAQAVQISAYPDYYAKWEQASYAWLAAHG